MKELEQLFGSKPRVKIMRLFLFNPEDVYDNEDISKKTKVAKTTVSKEMKVLEKSGLVKGKKFTKTIEKKLKTKTKKIKKKVSGYVLNQNFKHLFPLRNLLIKTEPLSQKGIENRFKKLGNIKLLLISGVFINENNAVVDILIVGSKLDDKNVEQEVSFLESEIGKELRYSFFDTEEFQHRTNIYDKLIRDILDNPHEKLINRLGI